MDPTASCLWRLAGEANAIIFRGAPGFEAHLLSDAWLVLSGEPFPMFNRGVIGSASSASDRLRCFMDLAQEKGMPTLLALAPEAAEALASPLEDLGMMCLGQQPLMVCQPQGVEPTSIGYKVEVVRDDEALGEAVQVWAAANDAPAQMALRVMGSGMLDGPGLTVFLAREGGIAVGSVVTVQAGSVVSIWEMATLPERRRSGAGRALLAHALNYHIRRETDTLFLSASDAGRGLYESFGFVTIVEMHVWLIA